MVELQQFRCGRRFCLAENEKAFKAAGEAVIEVEMRGGRLLCAPTVSVDFITFIFLDL